MQSGEISAPMSPGEGARAVPAVARRAQRALVGLGGLVLAAGPAAADGGFASSTWSWLALAALTLATLRLIAVPAVPFGWADLTFLAGMAAFAGWVALSTLWTTDVTATLDETLRDASYAATVLAVLLVVDRRSVEALLTGLLGGVLLVSGWSLMTRLLPDRIDGWDPATMFRLSGTIGYWNGLGIYAALGILLALGLALRSKSRAVTFLAGAAPVVLLPTILFTFSRGAWVGLAAGLLAMLAVDRRRLQLVFVGAILMATPAIALALAWRADNLTDSDVTLAQAASEGAPYFRWVLVLAAAGGVVAVAARLLGDRVAPGPGATLFAGAAVWAGVIAALVVVFATFGSPWDLADRGLDRIRSATEATSTDQTERLFDLSANGRLEQWRVSLDQFRDDPVLGAGAGTWEQAWNLNRDRASAVRDSHSLYLETLGELGVVGLALLAFALAVPLVAALRSRRRPGVLPATGAYVAFLAHAALDWDWELAGLTVVALAAAAALTIAARPDRVPATPRLPVRVLLPAVTAALALLAVASVMSTVPLARARASYGDLDFAAAERQAARAARWAPWSAEARDLLGRARLAQGELAGARTAFRQAVDRTPGDWELWRDLAAASPPAEARRHLERALRLSPLEPELIELKAQLDAIS